jgi:hypothetical protein
MILKRARAALTSRVDRSIALGLLLRRLRRFGDRLAHAPRRVANVAMLHAGRCGSSVLADLLDQRPDFYWAGELFELMPTIYYRMEAEHRAQERIANAMYRPAEPYFGFDSKYLPEQHLHPDLANKTVEDYVALLDALGFEHFILLGRRNHLRRAVSVAVGTKTGQWNTAGDVASTTVRLDIARFASYGARMPLVDYFQSLDVVHERVRSALRGRRLLELEYEDDIQADPRLAYDKTCAWLGLAPHEVRVRLRKINDRPLTEMLQNFSEVQAALRGTAYEWMLSA